jgi:hypothetical protein
VSNATGIDVSKWQASTPSLAGLSFLFARASIGTVADERYAMHIANAKAAGLITGAYHFGDNRTSAAAQAAAFLALAGDVDFYVLDHEGQYQMTSAEAKTFIATVRSARGGCGLYHSLSGFPDLDQDFNWVALWAGAPPTISWTFWQYSGSPLDQDVFHGTIDELRAFARGGSMQAAITDETPKIIDIGLNAPLYDLDGKTVLDRDHPALLNRPSPYAVGTKRATYVTIGTRRVVLVSPSAVRPLPTLDCTAAITTALDAAAIRAATAVKTP